MKIQQSSDGPLVVIELIGRFTFEDHKLFKLEVGKALASPGITSVVLDMKALSYLDSSALGGLLLLKEQAEAKGVRMSISKPDRSILSILKVVRFDQIFSVED